MASRRNFDDPFSESFWAPLGFDRVNEGRALAPSSSASRLLNLPIELLTKVMGNFDRVTDKLSLSSLAKVNRDCRQLARSCRFRSMTFDFDDDATYFAGVLLREAAQRSRNHGRTRGPSLGACIRQVAITSSHLWKELRALQSGRLPGTHSIDDFREPMTEEQLQLWDQNVSSLAHKKAEVYDPSLLFAISTLPHLDTIIYRDGVVLEQYTLDSLVATACKHLQAIVEIGDMNALVLSPPWSLETLIVNARWDWQTWYRRSGTMDASPFWGSLLASCSQSLQTLRIGHRTMLSKEMTPTSFTLDFPQLRCLDIDCTLDLKALKSLVTDRLTTLIVNFEAPITKDFLESRGQIRDLDLLIWSSFGLDDAPFKMLSDNSQLTAFGIRYGHTPDFLERALSALGSLDKLVSLSIIWDGTEIPESSLRHLSALGSVEHLHISAGNQISWRCDWVTNHDSIRTILAPLRKLKTLLITRDTYTRGHPTPANSDYYHMDSFRWDVHFDRMKRVACRYVPDFPDLQFMHLGQNDFRFDPDGVIVGEKNESFDAEKHLFGI